MPGIGLIGRRHAGPEANQTFEAEQSGRRDPIRWLVACGLVLIAAIAIGTAVTISNSRDRALASSERELQNNVLLLAQHFDQQLDDMQVPLDDLIAQMHASGVATPDDFRRDMSSHEMHLLMKAKVSGASEIAGINVYDADGTLINSSVVPVVPQVNIADRAYYKTLKAAADPNDCEIEMVRSRFSGGWRTVFARKMTGPNGEFLGIVSRA